MPDEDLTDFEEVEAESDLRRLSRQRDALRRERDQAIKANDRMQAKLDLLTALDASVVQGTPKWAAPKVGRTKQHRGIANLLLSDLHLDEVVKPGEVSGYNAYNRQIAYARLKRTIDQFVDVARNYLNGVTYDGAWVWLNGDIFSGTIHEELKETNEAPMMASFDYWIDPVAAGLRQLAEEFGSLGVSGRVGNHGRACFDDTTEILTRDRGWIMGTSLNHGDIVATVNPTTHCFEWQMPKAIHRYPFDGDLVAFRTTQTHLTVTPEHDIYVQGHSSRRGDKIYSYPLAKRQAGERVWSRNWRMLASAKGGWKDGAATPQWVEGTKRCPEFWITPSPLWAEFLGWWVSEGSADELGRIVLSQSERVHPLAYARFQEIIKGLGYTPRPRPTMVRFSNKPLALWLAKEFGRLQPDRWLPQWLLDWPSDLLEIFFDAAMEGDGYWESPTAGRYTSSSDRLHDGMQEVALKLGLSTSLKKRYKTVVPARNGNPAYEGSARKLHVRRDPLVPTGTPSRQAYQGDVWCVTVPNGLVITRQGGHAIVSGNSRKPVAKSRVEDNFDWLFYRVLQRELKDDKRITWDLPKSADGIARQYDTTFMATHGDQFRGGSGIAGILSPLALGDHRKTRRQTAVGEPYDRLIIGHFHQLLWLPRIICNGSLKGLDEYAFQGNFGFEVPQQAMWTTTPQRGVTFQCAIQPMDRAKEKW